MLGSDLPRERAMMLRVCGGQGMMSSFIAKNLDTITSSLIEKVEHLQPKFQPKIILTTTYFQVLTSGWQFPEVVVSPLDSITSRYGMEEVVGSIPTRSTIRVSGRFRD